MFEKGEVSVQPKTAVVRVAGSSRIPVRGNHANVGSRKNIFFDPSDCEIPSGNLTERSGLYIEQPGSPSVRFAYKLAAGTNRDDFAIRRQADVSAEEKSKLRRCPTPGAIVEYSSAFHEEFSRFGKVNREAGKVQNLRIHLCLGEIRVCSEVGREVGGYTVLHVFEPNIGMPVRLRPVWRSRCLREIGFHKRFDTQCDAAVQILESHQISGL